MPKNLDNANQQHNEVLPSTGFKYGVRGYKYYGVASTKYWGFQVLSPRGFQVLGGSKKVLGEGGGF